MSTESNLNPLSTLTKPSHSNLSHDPARQGERTIEEYEEELENDIAAIMGLHPFGKGWAQGEDHKKFISHSVLKYRKGYEKYLSHWVRSEYVCDSFFTKGGGSFPEEHLKKFRKWSDNHYARFRTWRTRALKRIKRFYTSRANSLELNK